MLETCYCGRTGELEDRNLVSDDDGREALECSQCGHLDHLSWLQDPTSVFEEAGRRAGDNQTTAA